MPKPRFTLIRRPDGLLELVDLERPLKERRVASGPPPGVPVRAGPAVREPIASGYAPNERRGLAVQLTPQDTPQELTGYRLSRGVVEGMSPRPAVTFSEPIISRPTTSVEVGTPIITRPKTATNISDMPPEQRERILDMAEQMRARPQEIHPADAIGISEAEARREVDERNYQRLLKSEDDRLTMEQAMAARSPHLPLEVKAAGYVGQSPMPNVRPVTQRIRNAADERLDDILVNMVEGSDPYTPPKPIVIETKRPLGAPKKRKSINFKYDVKAND